MRRWFFKLSNKHVCLQCVHLHIYNMFTIGKQSSAHVGSVWKRVPLRSCPRLGLPTVLACPIKETEMLNEAIRVV